MSSLLDRFFGRGTPGPGSAAVANSQMTDALSLSVLLDAPLTRDAAAVTRALRAYDPEMAQAVAELIELPPQEGRDIACLGLISWKQHVIKLVGVDHPIPAEALDSCMQPAHYSEDIKSLGYAHKANVLLLYAGYETDRLQQYVALAAASGALSSFGASFVLNDSGRTALRAATLLVSPEKAGSMLARLPGLVLMLYCGISKLEVEGIPGVWLRTYGAERLDMPDLAYHVRDHSHASAGMEIFTALFWYLRETDRPVSPGHTVQIGEDILLRLRAPTPPKEWFLESPGGMLVIEPDRGEPDQKIH